ncbi:N-acetylneuraminate lyase [Planctomycetes bacterium Pan216]|uniref:N-acetylneuraminate lyase n=1 Tax=Kolteria novifilia TaxID=2527975 RepID=A0A518B0A4_9BACT|nr:N-acetylneuraminate lyase [Planctomycetes bacterium Pan216]
MSASFDLIAAAPSPLAENGAINLEMVRPLVDHLVESGVTGLFALGTTGECMSLTTSERQSLAEEFVRSSDGRIPVTVHVGHNSLAEACGLATHAKLAGADAIAMLPPCYFKPNSLDAVLECLRCVASAGKGLPIYYYHIPHLTGVPVDIVELIGRADDTIDGFAGVKFTSPAVDLFQLGLAEAGEKTVAFGVDEMLLSGVLAGATMAIGSTYNFAAPLFLSVVQAFQEGDLEEARRLQQVATSMIHVLIRHGGLGAIKLAINELTVDCGPTRLPLRMPSGEQWPIIREELAEVGLFDWCQGLASADS